MAVFLVGGAAFATSSFVDGGARIDDSVPAADQATESPSETAEATEEPTRRPSESPETRERVPERVARDRDRVPSASPEDGR